MKKKQIMIIAAWVLTLVWMGIIFYLSNQPAVESSYLSTGLTKRFVSIMENIVPAIKNIEFDSLESCIRKNAHFIAYFILGVMLLISLKLSNVKKATALAISISIFYAMSDEFHQLFIFGRSCQFKDVLIDTAGAILGVFLVTILSRILARRS